MTRRPNEPMTPKVKENKAFADWSRDWIAVIQQTRASVERLLPEDTGAQTDKKHFDGSPLFGPKVRAASGRHLA